MALKPGQEKCINTLDRSIVVAAGAGSGKTFTLTKRIVHAIESGAVDGIERVCAITFTNKAAGELKSRIKAELRACGLAEQALKVDEAWVSTIHGMCARILRAHAIELDLDPAFQMADAAFTEQLKARAVEDALASVRDGAALRDAQAGACDSAGSARGTQMRPPKASDGAWGLAPGALDALFAEYPARSAGPRGSSVESMVRTLMDAAGSNARGFEAFVAPDVRVNPAALAAAVLDAFDALADAALSQKPNEAREAWAAKTAQDTALIRSQLEGGHAGDTLWVLRALDGLSLPRKAGTAEFKGQIADASELLRMCVMELRLAAAAPHLETLVALARQAARSYAAAKRVAGVLDNDDLLVMASAAITGHPELAAIYADKFQLVMVDEFQDTDQMQVDMIKRLSGPGACRLCTVGDAQQSIYRFRGADVSVYRRHLEEVRGRCPDDVILLPDNFRSHADVLALVDRVFEGPDMFGGEFMSLAPGRDEARVKRPFAQGAPRVQVQLTTNSYRGATSDAVRALAASRIADALYDLRERGHSAGEMALLLGGMAHAGVYAEALRARGLACVISGGSVFADAPEAQIVGDLVRVAANPYQTLALFNVLTSPLFELSAGDLLELATARGEDGSFRKRDLCTGLRRLYRDACACGEAGIPPVGYPGDAADVSSASAGALPAGGAPGAGALACRERELSLQLALAVRVMGAFMEDAGRERVSALVMRAVVDSGWLGRLEARGAEGLAQAANVYKAVRMVEDAESSSAAGPARVARLYQATLDESKEAPGALSATGGDFVRIMTVHASKGLEFPIVAVAEFKDPSGDSSRLLASELDGLVYLSLDLQNTLVDLEGAATPKDLPALYASMVESCAGEDELARAVEHAEGALALRAALYEHDRLGDAEEAKRLLYVALTRAKEALVVSLKGKRSKDNPNGTPKSCLGAIVGALAGSGESFAPGTSRYDFRGTAPAIVEHVALEAEDGDGTLARGAGGGAAPGCGIACAVDRGESSGRDGAGRQSGCPGASGELFAIPAPARDVPAVRVPYAPAHEGVFSYSSIAEAAHEGDVLEQLAARFFVSADAPLADGMPRAGAGDGAGDGLPAFGALDAADVALFGFAAFDAEDDGASWAFGGTSSADADKATDLGTAFHRLAQLAVISRGASGELRMPPERKVEALSRTCGLGPLQRARLREALARWFGCACARDMAAHDDLRAEVPFFVKVPAAGAEGGSYLEGEIDLLALDGAAAFVVDYKTGGSSGESEADLRLKHVLQAACYAYAIMLQGIESVEATFVRVERPCADDPAEPQCVRYRFAASDLPAIARALEAVYGKLRQRRLWNDG